MADIQAVTERVNAARTACSLAPVAELPNGERRNPCFCPLGRALRKDMEDSFFLAVGTKHIRIATSDGSASEIARRIQEAWGIGGSNLRRENEQFLTIPLPSELTQFVVSSMAGSCPSLKEWSMIPRSGVSMASRGGCGM